MKIQNVTDASFRKYGKVLEGYDFSALLKEMNIHRFRMMWFMYHLLRSWKLWM